MSELFIEFPPTPPHSSSPPKEIRAYLLISVSQAGPTKYLITSEREVLLGQV